MLKSPDPRLRMFFSAVVWMSAAQLAVVGWVAILRGTAEMPGWFAVLTSLVFAFGYASSAGTHKRGASSTKDVS